MIRRTFVIVATLGLLATACNGNPGLQQTGAPSPTQAGQVLIRAASSTEVNPHFDGGQDVFITDAGMKPHILVAAIGYGLMFHNETDSTVTVRARNTPAFSSGPIPPGGTYLFTTDRPLSVVYVSRPVGGIGKIQFSFPSGPLTITTPEPSP